jgi:plasmid stability protein
VTVSTIIGLENVLDELEGWVASWERERGRDPGLYYVRVFGDPAGDQPWSWRFGGHHVSINHTIVDGQVVASTPCFLGADPASSPLLGPHLLRPLGAAEDLGRELVHALRPDQLAQALLSPVAPVDLVTGNRTVVSEGDEPPHLRDIWRRRFTDALAVRVDTMQADAERLLGLQPDHIAALRFTAAPKGISAEELSVEQRELLRALLEVYVHRVPDELADLQLAKFAAERDLDRLSFAWAGGIESGQPHYYRVQGSHLLAEYDNTQRGTNHVHTVWRDLANDFGVDHLAQHYAEHDHH